MLLAALAVGAARVAPCATRSQSQSGEEEIYLRRFAPAGRGVYVEIGALDGHTFSNTRVLSRCRGWSGLLVEANVANYAALLRRLDRANVTVRHAAVCRPPQAWANMTEHGGAVAGDVGRMSPSFVRRWRGANHPERTVPTPCTTMDELLGGRTRVDFFSLDVEGAEHAVVSTIDFARVRIDTFCIEMDRHDPPKNAAVASLLAARGYERCAVPEDARNGWFRAPRCARP